MAFDALLKKYFPLIVLALVAVAAYFHAAGTSRLLGSAMGVDEAALVHSAKASGAPQVERPGRPNAQPIIDRNPFDSITGPLKPPPMSEGEARRNKLDLSDPLSAEPCGDVEVFIVTESDDPTWSVAAIKGSGDSHPTLRRVGDEVGGKKVAFIGYNPREATPSVWLLHDQDTALCQSFLFAQEPTAPKPGRAAAQPTSDSTPKVKRGPAKVPDDIAGKIQKVSESEFNVDRSVVDKIIENQAELMKSARIVPEKKDGKVVGIRLFGIRPDTLLGTLGFENGDRLETINGYDMTSPEKALEAYARLRTAQGINVKVNRRGKAMAIDYRIK